MSLILSVTSSSDQILKQKMEYEFNEEGGTIGRKLTNTWVLPDECRHLSGSHATIEYKNGVYSIIDTSTNGVFVNGSAKALGRGLRAELENGSQLVMGTYNIEVHLNIKPEVANETAELMADDVFADLDDEEPAANATSDINVVEDKNSADPLKPDVGAKAEVDHFQSQDDSTDIGSDDPFFEFGEFSTDDDIIEIPEKQSTAEGDNHQEFDSFFEAPKIRSIPDDTGLFKEPVLDDKKSRQQKPEFETGMIPNNWDAISSSQSGSPTKGAFDDFLTGIGDPFETPKECDVDLSSASSEAKPNTDDSVSIDKYQTEKQPKVSPKTNNHEPSLNESSRNSEHSDHLMHSFIKGLGLDDKDLKHSLSDKHLLMAGKLFRIAVQGTMEVLQSRAEIKNEMRMDMTTIQPTQNNPIKFALSTNEALSKLLIQKNQSYMNPEQAMEEAYDDIKSHQVAIISGIQASLVYVLKRFQPENLIKRLEKESPIGSSIPIHRKAKLWDKFEDLYDTIEAEAEDDFNRLFGQEFAKAYDEQVAQLKKKRGM